ncbi:MAG: metallopeptidase TldD-related protein [Candidatus Binataceae bacterium]
MMVAIAELKAFVRDATRQLSRERDFIEFEVYAASSAHRIARISHTSDIPCRGVEEIKSLGADGFEVRVAMRRDPHEIGTAFEAGDLSRAALQRVVERARRSAIVDPHFPGFARDPRKFSVGAAGGGDLARASDAALASSAWQIVGGALRAFRAGNRNGVDHPGLVIGGDVSIIHDRIAIGGSNFPDVRGDESAHFISSVTAIVESIDAKGTATAVGGTTAQMRRAGAALGGGAIRRALALGHGVRPASGKYRVILGPQPVAEILNYMVIGSLTTGAFYAASSAYQGKFGARVMDERIAIVDDPMLRAGAVHRRVTCEGLPAGKTELIRAGRLIGLLSNVYDSHRLETDEAREKKLGALGKDATFAPVAGYRLGEGGGRRFDADPGATATNVVMRARGGASDRAMLQAVGDGIYVGRIWYTYPINGQRAGDFTCTVTGDSYLIRNGKLATPLAPNCLRINANIADVFDSPLSIGARITPTIVWGAAETYFVPAVAAKNIMLAEIGTDPS